jgi:hypothetical protein
MKNIKFYIDLKTEKVFMLTDVCVSLSENYMLFGQHKPATLPENAIELMLKPKKSWKLLSLTRNPIKNIQLFFNKELAIYIQSERWINVIRIVKNKLNLTLTESKNLIETKLRKI